MAQKASNYQSLAALCETIEFSETIKQMALKNQHTDDLPYLSQFNGHLVFVYGTFKTSFPRHAMLQQSNAKFVAAACTHEKFLMLANQGYDRFPILFRGMSERVKNQGSVLGQLFTVDTKTLSMLDGMEGNPQIFRRTTVPVQIMSKPRDNKFQLFEVLPVWMYLGNKVYWGNAFANNMLDTVQPVPVSAFHGGGGGDREFLNWTHNHQSQLSGV